MADIFTKEKRSEVMSRIRGRGNVTTERVLARLMRAAGISGWRRHRAAVSSRQASIPDFIFPAQRVCIFVDGCFWHGCPRCFREPTSNVQYWRAKIARNQKRDRRTVRLLRAAGFGVYRVWECQLKRPAFTAAFLRRVRTKLFRSK